MQFPLTAALRDEIETFQLRSACPHCFYYVERDRSCAHEWPNEEQRRWPIERAEGDAEDGTGILQLCKEFELR